MYGSTKSASSTESGQGASTLPARNGPEGLENAMAMAGSPVVRQHLIDPEICIRCNTCEATCPVAAITHDSNNYVVDAEKCESCLACIAPCPTGSIDNWRL